jgi:hypothetical protein
MTILANPLYASRRFDTIAALAASGLTYASGSVNTVVAGNRVEAEGLQYEVAPSGAVDQHITTAGGARLYRVTQRSVEVTVGSGGQFATINAAITYLDGQRRTYGGNATATIRLLSGFVMAEQVIIRGQDLSWITIVSNTSPVGITFSALTTNVVDKDGISWRPAFTADNGALPVIGCLFEMTAGGGGLANGMLLLNGARALILPNCGINNAAGRGVMLQSSTLIAHGASIRNSVRHNLYAENGSFVFGNVMNLDRDVSNVSNFGNVFIIQGCMVDIRGSSIANARNHAVQVRDGSVAVVRDCTVTNATGEGIWCYRGAICDATDAVINGVSIRPLFAQSGGIIDASRVTITGAGETSAEAQLGSTLVIDSANITTTSLFSTVRCGSASTIEARGVTISAPAGAVAIFAENGGRIGAVGATANNCQIGARVGDGGYICAVNGTFTGCATAGAQSAGGEIDLRGANCRRSPGVDGSSDIRCFDGGVIKAFGSLGGLNKTANTLDANGVIYK